MSADEKICGLPVHFSEWAEPGSLYLIPSTLRPDEALLPNETLPEFFARCMSRWVKEGRAIIVTNVRKP
jgi:hypothetical protein